MNKIEWTFMFLMLLSMVEGVRLVTMLGTINWALVVLK